MTSSPPRPLRSTSAPYHTVQANAKLIARVDSILALLAVYEEALTAKSACSSLESASTDVMSDSDIGREAAGWIQLMRQSEEVHHSPPEMTSTSFLSCFRHVGGALSLSESVVSSEQQLAKLGRLLLAPVLYSGASFEVPLLFRCPFVSPSQSRHDCVASGSINANACPEAVTIGLLWHHCSVVDRQAHTLGSSSRHAVQPAHESSRSIAPMWLTSQQWAHI
jgi:hypothetical protein